MYLNFDKFHVKHESMCEKRYTSWYKFIIARLIAEITILDSQKLIFALN